VNESETIVTAEAHDEDRFRDLAHLSAAVGHFLINAFSAVVSNAEQIRSRADRPTDPAQIETLSTSIIKSALDASQVARQLIDWTRHLSIIDSDPNSAGSRFIDLNRLIQERIESAPIATRSDIDRVMNLSPIPSIAGDAARLRSMLCHLLQNANEAMEGRSGTLTVSTCIDPRGWTVIEICDTGPGMSPEVLRQATEPFFSTKPDHTGIGLTIAQAIWRRHRGSLAIDSQPGRGTTIRLSIGPPPPPRPVPQPTTSSDKAETSQPTPTEGV
jgi:signal transduction histidine kinase